MDLLSSTLLNAIDPEDRVLVEALAAVDDSTRQYQSRVYEDFLYQDQCVAPHMAPRPGESSADFATRIKMPSSFARLVLSIKARTYTFGGGPQRQWGSQAEYWRTFEDGPDRFHLNLIYREADYLLPYLGTMLVEVRYAEGYPPRLYLWRPWQVSAVTAVDPTQPTGLRLQVDTATVAYYTPRSRYLVKSGELVQSWYHGYGFLPIVTLRDNPLWYSMWYPGFAQDLYRSSCALTDLWSEVGDLGLHCFGQPCFNGMPRPLDAPPFIGKDVPIYTEGGASFSRVAAAHDISSALKIIEQYQNTKSLNYGLNPGSFYLEFYKGDYRSGPGIQASQTGPADERAYRIEIWSKFEGWIVDMVERVVAAHGMQVDADGFRVVFPSFPQDQIPIMERRQDDAFDLDHGLVIPWRVLQRRYPELSVDEARAMVDEAVEGKEVVGSVYEQIAMMRFQLTILGVLRPGVRAERIKEIIEGVSTGQLVVHPEEIDITKLAEGGGDAAQ